MSRRQVFGGTSIKMIFMCLLFALVIFTFTIFLRKFQRGEISLWDFQSPVVCKFSEGISSGSDGISLKELIEGIPQNDSRILEYIRANHLSPPSPLPYNLSQPEVDPGDVIGQNKAVKKILGDLKNGFFIDAGAHDGEYISNTLGFERDHGWTGLLVEPSPIELPNLISKNRKAWIANVCLSPTALPSKIDYLHRINYTIASKLGTAEDIGAYGNYWKLMKVPCFPLFSLISALGIKTVDYFSLDVEGVELSVLKTIPFDSILIKVFSIEYNLIPEGKKVLRKFMESKGYIFAEEVYHDYIFVHKSLNYKPKPVVIK